MAARGATSGPPPLLILFDIDGTLLGRASSAHVEALHEALRQVHGVDARGARAQIGRGGPDRRRDRAASAARSRRLRACDRRGRRGGARRVL